MEKEIEISPEAKGTMKIADGKIVVGIKYQGKQAGADASVTLDVKQFAQLLKDAIPGKMDDTVIDLLVAAMGGV